MTRKTLLTLGLLAIFVLSACTPNVSVPDQAPESGVEPAAPPAEESAPVQEETPAVAEPTAEQPMAMPTSRGAQLVATDPGTVNLTSGQPQLIEFFAFW